MKVNYYGNIFDQLKEEGDGGRLNSYPDNKNFYEGMEEMNQVEKNLTGKKENPSFLSGSTGSSENIKNSEINQEKIEDKNEAFRIYLTLKENEKKLNENSIEEIEKKSVKFNAYPTLKEIENKMDEDSMEEIEDKNEIIKIDPTPKENENKMNGDSIEKKKETISQDNVKSSEKESSNIIFYSDSNSDIDMENDNDDYQSQIINESMIGSNHNEQEIDFSTVTTVSTNQGVWGEGYAIIVENIPPYSYSGEDDDRLNSSNLSIFGQIECNHHH